MDIERAETSQKSSFSVNIFKNHKAFLSIDRYAEENDLQGTIRKILAETQAFKSQASLRSLLLSACTC